VLTAVHGKYLSLSEKHVIFGRYLSPVIMLRTAVTVRQRFSKVFPA